MPAPRPPLRGVEARNALAAANVRLLYYVAKRLRRANPAVRRMGTLQDTAQAGVPGLLHACAMHDAAKGGFATYAYYCIRGKILDAAHKAGPVATYAKVGFEAAPKTILSPHRHDRLSCKDRPDDECRLDLAEALAALRPRDRLIVTRHLAGESYRTIAADLGVTRMRAWSIGQRALAALRESLAAYGPGEG